MIARLLINLYDNFITDENEACGMIVNITSENLSFYEALASRTRLNIIQQLAKKDCNIKELAENLQVSSAIMTKHIRKLEAAGIVKAHMVKKKRFYSKNLHAA
jgi:predicted transcriptional regulator